MFIQNVNVSAPKRDRLSAPPHFVHSVSSLSRLLQSALQQCFPGTITVKGELSAVRMAVSGHLYFCLKDKQSQVRCVMFRVKNQHIQFDPEDGQFVQLSGLISIYLQRGDLQLIVDQMTLCGNGDLFAQFQALKNKLSTEGLFDAEHKLPLPKMPRIIAVVTSYQAAALQDVLKVLQTRMPLLEVHVFHAQVQGNSAPKTIMDALVMAQERDDIEAIVLVRGGGSVEDLHAFNDETLARAMYACKIPIICGVGHEIDFTIADFVSDLRVPTPTAAAEAVVPHITQLQDRVVSCRRQLVAEIRSILQNLSNLCAKRRGFLSEQHPQRLLHNQLQITDELYYRVQDRVKNILLRTKENIRQQKELLYAMSPMQKIQQLSSLVSVQSIQLCQKGKQILEQRHKQLDELKLMLHALSPQSTMQRGYCIARALDGTTITSVKDANINQELELLIADGKVNAKVLTKTVTSSPSLQPVVNRET